MQIVTEVKRAKHPFLRGEYMNGNTKTIGIKNLDVEEINSYVADLRNQIGRKVGDDHVYHFYIPLTISYA